MSFLAVATVLGQVVPILEATYPVAMQAAKVVKAWFMMASKGEALEQSDIDYFNSKVAGFQTALAALDLKQASLRKLIEEKRAEEEAAAKPKEPTDGG